VVWGKVVFRVRADENEQLLWYALNPDEVTVNPTAGGRYRVENQVGGSTFAVRCRIGENGAPLTNKTQLIVPIKLDRDVRVGVHVQISGQSYYFPYAAPETGLRYLLTPDYETAPPTRVYRQPFFTEDQVKKFRLPGRVTTTTVVLGLRELLRDIKDPVLESITIGNSSNHDYLLLGGGHNPAGSTYTVGRPQLR